LADGAEAVAQQRTLATAEQPLCQEERTHGKLDKSGVECPWTTSAIHGAHRAFDHLVQSGQSKIWPISHKKEPPSEKVCSSRHERMATTHIVHLTRPEEAAKVAAKGGDC
jgi:hypothetical protein